MTVCQRAKSRLRNEALLLENLWENMELAAARWARWSAVVPAADCLFVPRSFFIIIFERMPVTLQSMPSMHCCSTELFSLCPQFCCIWDTCWFLLIPGHWFHNNTIILHIFINGKWLLPPNNEICAPRLLTGMSCYCFHHVQYCLEIVYHWKLYIIGYNISLVMTDTSNYVITSTRHAYYAHIMSWWSQIWWIGKGVTWMLGPNLVNFDWKLWHRISMHHQVW